MTKNLFLLAIAFALCFLYICNFLNPALAEEIARFHQDRFAIGFWVDPPLDEKADVRYKEIADANFTLVVGVKARTPKEIYKQLELCEKYNLKTLVRTRGLNAEDYPTSSSACWGYLLKDEPSAADFKNLARKVEKNRERYPGKLSFINLYPNYANSGMLGKNTYEKYISDFMKIVNPDVLCMDHYPIFRPDGDGRDLYCSNLETMRKYSLKFNIPFWNFFNVMPYGSHTDPTEAQIRWQIYTSLAYGAKGVLYFCYFTPTGDEFPKGGAIIAIDGTQTHHYDEALRINGELKNLGAVIMQLTSTDVYRIPPGCNSEDILTSTPLKRISKSKEDPDMDYLVGVFKHADGRQAVLINNYHIAYNAWPTVEFRSDMSQVCEIDKISGEEITVRDSSPKLPGVQLFIPAGTGRLFLISSAKPSQNN
ncbi:MAG TPA: hypothetical protein PKW18_01550 [Candidatus Sumerlaeota bacterium]|nr:MAG: hypothetical protein BWY12_00226 [candidate division BRC1 bacterium ADurb.Bin183]HOE62252.1 hypothetical protein [Candidatus Sumerlaeota bacterium]HRR31261.1 hypothetical protein [Candidatus Sumerlaeia bacterium]HON49167.1 hypothetical protein [Candidatus Sumerlaeota bacterium]HOR64226.1 hypothetical protein [Candidatus Sumerlaeota bacterium]